MPSDYIIDRLIVKLRDKKILEAKSAEALLAMESPSCPPRPAEIRLIEALRENNTLTDEDVTEIYAHT